MADKDRRDRKNLTMDEIISNMNKSAKELIVTKGLNDFNYDRIPFTSPMMNYCTYGGIPIGKLVEFSGEEHGGKTTSALDIVGNYQKMQDARRVLYVDSENTLDPQWAAKIGVDVDNMDIMQPKSQSAEEILDFIVDCVYSGEVGLWVLDSIGALFSEQEFEKSIGDKTYAGISGPLTKFSKFIVQAMNKTHCTGIGINQIREDLNSTWGGTTTPGGRGWRHMCALRMEFRRGPFVDIHGKEITRSSRDNVGNIVKVNIPKTKICPPDRHIAEYTLNYANGINYIHDLVELALMLDVIDQRGAWFTVVNKETGEVIAEKIQGQDKLEQYLTENEPVLCYIETELDRIITTIQ